MIYYRLHVDWTLYLHFKNTYIAWLPSWYKIPRKSIYTCKFNSLVALQKGSTTWNRNVTIEILQITSTKDYLPASTKSIVVYHSRALRVLSNKLCCSVLCRSSTPASTSPPLQTSLRSRLHKTKTCTDPPFVNTPTRGTVQVFERQSGLV